MGTRPAGRKVPQRVWLPLAAGVGLLAGLWIPWSGRPGCAPNSVQVDFDASTAPGDAFDWTLLPKAAFPIPPFTRYLDGVTIVLDPGHGGRGDVPNYKRGPTGLREAEVNLRVALFLREFLEQAGARVSLTREDDVYLDPDNGADLTRRAEIANRAAADLLLSIHHNASDNEDANYTAVFYHGNPEHSPASLDAGRQLLIALQDALRLESQLPTALLSDYAMYPGKGFRVLREAHVPAILAESSFHSNPAEEQRLRRPLYNRREAYGMFLGLARWAQGGLPRVRLVRAASSPRGGAELRVQLDDGLRSRGGWGSDLPSVSASSLIVRLDGRDTPFDWEPGKREITLPLPRNWSAPGVLYVDFTNRFGQHVLHPRLAIE